MLSLTWPSALAWRLRRQLLEPVGATSATDVVGRLGAVAAQLDPAAAELGVRTRSVTSRPGDLARAVAEGALVATFAFRGAVHLMTPDQAGVHLALRASSRMWERASWRSHYRLDPADWPALRAAVREALADGPLTRAELAAAVAARPGFGHLGPAFTHPSATFLKPFAWQGDLALGPSRDGDWTLQGLDANPRWAGLPDLDTAGRRAIESYLRAYGPASVDNVQYWLGEGLGVRRALSRGWLAGLGERVAEVAVDGERRLVLAEDLDELAAARPTDAVRLLPKYDQWVLGPGTADPRVVPPALRPEVSRGANLVVVGGVVAGTWTVRDEALVLTWSPNAGPHARSGTPTRPSPPTRPSSPTRAGTDTPLAAEVARLGELLQRPLHLASSAHPARASAAVAPPSDRSASVPGPLTTRPSGRPNT